LRFKGGMFGYPVIYDGGLTYSIETAAARGYAFRLNTGAMSNSAVDKESALLDMTIPAPSAPSGVFRTGTNFDRPDKPTEANRLRAVSSLAELNANPLTTYFYDAAKGQVVVKASARWVIVQP
jgi:hypothetical protein